MLEMSWITAILQLYSQVADLFGNVIVKRINKRLFDLLARFHYILNHPRIRFPVNSYSSQFVPILVNSYSKFWSIRIHSVNFYSCRGQLVLILVNSYLFWSIRTHIQMSTN